MKRIALYHFGTVLLLLTSNTAHAVKFDIKKGFIYEEQELEKIKQEKEEEKLSKSYVKVLRLFNEDNKVSDPVLNDQANTSTEVKFLTINDTVTHATTDHEEAARHVASLNGALDWPLIEKNLIELESQFGIRSMPVVQFTKTEALDRESFKHRVEFLENKLGIEPESQTVSAIPMRLIVIKQKLNIETETLGLDMDMNL